jgi:hypothetical protein
MRLLLAKCERLPRLPCRNALGVGEFCVYFGEFCASFGEFYVGVTLTSDNIPKIRVSVKKYYYYYSWPRGILLLLLLLLLLFVVAGDRFPQDAARRSDSHFRVSTL